MDRNAWKRLGDSSDTPESQANNAVRFTARDGRTLELSLEFLVEKNAVIVDTINGAPIKDIMGAENQLWIPGVPAKYYLRDIVDIHLYHANNPPVLDFDGFQDDGHDYTNRPNIAIKAPYLGTVGVTMELGGWAHDFNKRIVAVQLSLDQGQNWTEFPLENTVPEKVVTWSISWTPTRAGRHQLMARAVNEDGRVSPLPAQHSFDVVEP